MTTMKARLSSFELEARYEAAADGVAKSHFMRCGFLSSGYEVAEVAELLSFSTRWVRALIKRYNEGGPEALGDQRIHNGTKPTILTPAALAALKARIKTPPDDGGLWTGPKSARALAKFHGLASVHDQRGWDALIAIGYSIQQPRPRHPAAASEQARAALKKTPERGGRGAAQTSGRGGRDLGDGRTPHRSQADHARRVGAGR
jgi:transposase